MILICMYNEEPKEMEATLNGILENIRGFAELGLDHSKIGVVVVSDGRIKIGK